MALPYAEVIGDPVAHSKSPLIHRFWLEKLGLEGDYRAVRVRAKDLPIYLKAKRTDSCWRGCNVTAPLKQAAAGLVGTPAGLCDFIGAINCVTRTPLSCLIGTNTDLAGVAEALKDVDVEGRRAVLIGAGGAARSALCWLVRHKAREVHVAVREPARAELLATVAGGKVSMRAISLAEAAEAMREAALIINATPMGMSGGPAIAPSLLKGFAAGQTAFDMVYAPVETDFLAAARARGARTVDGLAMLIGQAAPAFELFFGAPAPREHDEELRERLAA